MQKINVVTVDSKMNMNNTRRNTWNKILFSYVCRNGYFLNKV